VARPAGRTAPRLWLVCCADVTEIQVNALTGKIVSQKKESVAQEASEASKEAREK
jgi:hypothetical protein